MWSPDRPCTVVDIKGFGFTVTHLVIRDGDMVETKCGKKAPQSDSYKGTYGNITCRTCRR